MKEYGLRTLAVTLDIRSSPDPADVPDSKGAE